MNINKLFKIVRFCILLFFCENMGDRIFLFYKILLK